MPIRKIAVCSKLLSLGIFHPKGRFLLARIVKKSAESVQSLISTGILDPGLKAEMAKFLPECVKLTAHPPHLQVGQGP
jgi:hypothetical protein